MDYSRFDDFTRALAATNSRRHFLKTFTGGAAGGLLALLGKGTADAKPTCKPNGHGCGTNKQCCSGYCDQTTSTCACSPGTTQLCNGTCATDCSTTGCPNGYTCVQDEAVGHFYCAQGGATQTCSSDCDCPIGQMCINATPTGLCVAVY